jgi:hypothetical protein
LNRPSSYTSPFQQGLNTVQYQQQVNIPQSYSNIQSYPQTDLQHDRGNVMQSLPGLRGQQPFAEALLHPPFTRQQVNSNLMQPPPPAHH